jgi:hypothetical protein
VASSSLLGSFWQCVACGTCQGYLGDARFSSCENGKRKGYRRKLHDEWEVSELGRILLRCEKPVQHGNIHAFSITSDADEVISSGQDQGQFDRLLDRSRQKRRWCDPC